MSENIPFFNELPQAAIKPACRLWDAMMSPGYNGVIAYNDFCQDLTRAGISPPPRGVVRRWKAGVQLGMIERPAPASEIVPLPMQVPVPTPAAPDTDAEAEALPRHQPSPVKAKAERKRREKVETTKVDALVASPDTGEAVQSTITTVMDEDTRKISGVVVDASAEPPKECGLKIAPVIDDAEALLDAVAAELNAAPMPGQPARVITDNGAAFVAMKTAAGRLLEENIIQLSVGIEQTARETTARMLREVAAELEGGAV